MAEQGDGWLPGGCREKAPRAVAEQLHLPCAAQLADVVDSEALQVYMKPPAHEESKAPSKGFVVRDAPWTSNSSEKVRWHFCPGYSLWAKLVGYGAWAGVT